MKHLNEQEQFFKLKKPALLDYKVWNSISRGLRAGTITSYEVAPNYNHITVNFSDKTNVIVKLKKIIKTVSFRVKDKQTSQHNQSKYVDRKYTRYTSDMENTELYKLLIKPINVKTKEKTSNTITHNNQTYPSKDINEMIKDLKSYQRLIELGLTNTSSSVQINRGSVQLTRDNWPDEVKYCIYKTGKIYKGSAFQPMYAAPPFETLEDYDKALQVILKEREERFRIELERWKKEYEKDEASILKAPVYIIKELNPRLGKIAKTGIFENGNN